MFLFQEHNIETYLIKQVRPTPRKRLNSRFSRPRLWSEDEKAGGSMMAVKTGGLAPNLHINGTRENHLAYIEEETTTEWTPEIPFDNVS